MNEEQFEIWKRKKEAECELEVGYTPNFESFTVFHKENNIRKKYQEEIELMKKVVHDEEVQRSAWVPNGNWRPMIVSLGLSIITAILVRYLR